MSSAESDEDQCNWNSTNYFYNLTMYNSIGERLQDIETPLKVCSYSQIFFEDNHLIFLDEDFTIKIYNLNDMSQTSNINNLDHNELSTDISFSDRMSIVDISQDYTLILDTGENGEDEFWRVYDNDKGYTNQLDITNFIEISDSYDKYNNHRYLRSFENSTGYGTSELFVGILLNSFYRSTLVITAYSINTTVFTETSTNRNTGFEIYNSFHFKLDLSQDTIQPVSFPNVTKIMENASSLSSNYVYNGVFNTSIISQVIDYQTNVTIYDHRINEVIYQGLHDGTDFYYNIYEESMFYFDQNYIQLESNFEIITINKQTGNVYIFEHEYPDHFEAELTGEYIINIQIVPGNLFIRLYGQYILFLTVLLLIVLVIAFTKSYMEFRREKADINKSINQIEPSQ